MIRLPLTTHCRQIAESILPRYRVRQRIVAIETFLSQSQLCKNKAYKLNGEETGTDEVMM